MQKLTLTSFHSTGHSLYLQFDISSAQWRSFQEFLHALFPNTKALEVLKGVKLASASNFHFEFEGRGIEAHLVVGAKGRVHAVFHLTRAEKKAVADLLKHTTKWTTHHPQRALPRRGR